MEILNSMTLIDLVINIAILIVLIMITVHFILRSFERLTNAGSKEPKSEKNMDRAKYLSWIDRFRDDYEKQVKYIQGFQVNLTKSGIYLLVILICQNTIDFDPGKAGPFAIIFFILGFILLLIMLVNIIRMVPGLLKTSKEIRDFLERNKISDEGLEIYDQKYFGVTMKDVIGLRKENRNDTYIV